MKATTYAALGIGTALLIGACVMLEDRIGDVIGEDTAALVVDAGCGGGIEFAASATEGLSPLLTELVLKGVKMQCDRRAASNTIAANVYDTPLGQFCGEARLLTENTTPDADVRTAFNGALQETCKGAG